MQLYFGPNLRYFFSDGKGNYRYRAPQSFIDLFAREQIKEVTCVAFGMGDSFFVAYTRINGEARHHFEHNDHYSALKAWLFDEGLNHSSVNIALGMNEAFFATSSQGHRWRNIPEDACDYYQKFTRPDLFMRRRIHQLDLGYQGAFLGVGVDNVWFWDLAGQYPSLEALNPAANLHKAKTVTINPFAPDQHFIVFADSTTHYSLPPQWAGDIAQLFQQYASQTIHAQGYGSYTSPGASPFPSPPAQGYPSPPPYGAPAPSQFSNPYMQQWQQYQQQPLSDKKPKFWQRKPSQTQMPSPPQTQSPPPSTFQPPNYQSYTPPAQPATAKPSHFDVNGAVHLANNTYDAYNNVTNGGGQTTSSPFDVNQAVNTMNSSLNTINQASNYGSQGLDLVNQVTNQGLMVGQIAGQFGGAMAGCSVM